MRPRRKLREIILKQDRRVWTGFIWLRIVTCSEDVNEPLGCINCWKFLE
jgi:hypothetical protein